MVFKETLNSLTVGLGFVVGYLILGILLRGNHWRVAQSNISSQFGTLPKPRHIDGQLHVSIGLQQVEVTLIGKIQNGSSSLITYQESFPWNEAVGNSRHRQLADGICEIPTSASADRKITLSVDPHLTRLLDKIVPSGDGAMVHHLRRGLRGGLPYPVLTVLEHMAAQEQVWGRKFAFSGRLVTLLLWLSFSSGLVSALLGFLGEARPLSACLGITGTLLLVAVSAHDFLTPPATVLLVHFSKGHLVFTHGWCYILLLYLGMLSVFLSVVSMTVSHLERLAEFLAPAILFLQKMDHYFQKHTTGIKATA